MRVAFALREGADLGVAVLLLCGFVLARNKITG